MWKFLTATTVGLLITAAAHAGYIEDREAAMKLLNEREYAKALEKFEAMAQTEGLLDQQKADALGMAAECAGRLKQQDKAFELAEQIPVHEAQVLTKLELMNSLRMWDEGAEQFKDEPLNKYPARYRADALYLRGRLNFFADNGEAADEDLQAARDAMPDSNRMKPHVLLIMASNYRSNLDKPEKALEAYRAVHAFGHTYRSANGAIGAAEILLAMDKPDEALAELDKVDINEMSTSHPFPAQMLHVRARVLAAQGKTDEAIATLEKALELPKAPQRILERVEATLAELTGEGEDAKAE